ncbi:hypothetical protein [Aureibacillus halotolerans]|uniref:Uncharacterized protein n=1 Tax=Aureibacillus halotolerans TaxID=1508390 RepID=A0A4R6TYE1_9BACI|nr:hypothetical protein [Aureibacillus halotolerans]TDQ37413.1 hypothetical protein EV213_11347 [Aureibacillus halotolerans]
MSNRSSLFAQRTAAQRAYAEKRITQKQYEDVLTAIERQEKLRQEQQSNTLKKVHMATKRLLKA